MVPESTALMVYLVVVLTLAAVASLAAVAVIGETVLRNRRVRLARRQSVRTYYGGLVLHH